MHSTLEFQNESRESPSRHQVSVDLVLFLESTVHFYDYMLNTFHTKDTYTLNHKPGTFYLYFSFILSSIPSCCHAVILHLSPITIYRSNTSSP